MNKPLALAAIALTLGMTACDNDSPSLVTSANYVTTNLVIPSNTSEDVKIQEVIYTNSFDVYAQLLSISSNNLIIGSGAGNLDIQSMPYSGWNTTAGSIIAFDAENISGTFGSMSVTGFKGAITDAAYYNAESVPGVNVMSANSFIPKVIMQYKVGNDYTVKTFSRDAVYMGKTTTSVMGMSDQFTSEDISYRVVFKDEYKKADVVMYNVQFNEKMPKMKLMLLRDLDVQFNHLGYVITGSDIIPLVREGEGQATSTGDPFKDYYTEYTSFPFTSFMLTNQSDDLNRMDLQFMVAGRFRGTFTGSYALTSINTQN